MLDAISIATFLWLGFWAWLAIRKLAVGTREAIHYLIVIHFILNGLPLFLDILFGKPDYYYQPGFYLATGDEQVAGLYCVYASAVPVFWWFAGRSRSLHLEHPTPTAGWHAQTTLRPLRPVFYCLLMSPALALLAAPEPQLYLTYGWIARVSPPTLAAQEYHEVIVLAALLSVLAAAGLLASAKRLRLTAVVPLAPWLILAIWLNGKRHLFVIALLALWYVFWQRGIARRASFYIIGLLLAYSILVFSVVYQENTRGISIRSSGLENFYESLRIDYARDDRIKMALYAELHPDVIRILEYRGQSLLFDLTMYVPRQVWPDKPLPYAQYFTSAMLMSPPRMWGWGMTTTWLDEAIANFGWLGMLLGPLFPAVLCRVGDSAANALAYSLTALTSSLLLAVQLPAFAPLFWVWVAVIAWSKWQERRKTRPRPLLLPSHPARRSARQVEG
jgi:hypothetical protein